ncbi:hypothetical protein ABZV24_30995 [Streptomyces sp. NPDC005251]|uniref:hypothetical protein n=1 Tax=Streptomyces sp. NPDC005251 TaxID=3157166 RepID=UPI0033B227FE
MGVYTSWNRTDTAPKRAAEPHAEFFERVAGPFWDQVRDVINEWWSRFPDQDQPGLLSRLRDRNSDTNVFSALWELYLHQMLLGSGCRVEVEQQRGTRGNKPDFLVTRGDKQFVVEAIWKAQKLRDTGSYLLPPQLSDAIDRLPSPNFFVSCKLHSAGSATPPQKRLKTELTRWLASLDPDQTIADYERKVPLPKHTWEQAGWCLTFEAIPRSPGKRGDPSSRTIGVYPSVWVVEDGSERVLDAVTYKGGKYGVLELPFIVAVGHAADFPEDEDVAKALYGSTVEYAHASGSTFGRKPDGYWTATYDHAHSRVSGVLVVDNPAPWTWTKNTPVLWRSPDSNSLPAPVLPTWATAELSGIQVERRPANRPVHTALDLPERWPIGDAFPQRHGR